MDTPEEIRARGVQRLYIGALVAVGGAAAAILVGVVAFFASGGDRNVGAAWLVAGGFAALVLALIAIAFAAAGALAQGRRAEHRPPIA